MREGNILKQIFGMFLQIKRSLIAFFAVLALGLLSMGLLGAGIYYAVYPLLSPFFGNPDDWNGDWVWPSAIMAGMLWSFSFIVAGLVNLRLMQSRWGKLPRRMIYISLIWLGAGLIWMIILLANY